MANLKEEAKWEEGIYQYELDDPLQGGEDGIDNVQGRQLANRTSYLREKLSFIAQKFAEAKHESSIQIDTLHKEIKGVNRYRYGLVNEHAARNLLYVLGIRPVNKALGEPATREELKQTMDILQKKIRDDGNWDCLNLQLGDYLDLPEINDGHETYKWDSSYCNLRIIISAFNFYKSYGYPARNWRNHIVFTFRNIVCKRPIDTKDTNPSSEKVYEDTQLAAYLDEDFRKGLETIMGISLCSVNRCLFDEKVRWSKAKVFLPTLWEVAGYNLIHKINYYHGFSGQYPIFKDSLLYHIKKYNGSSCPWWTASRVPNLPGFYISAGSTYGNAHSTCDEILGVAPAFCIGGE